MCTKYAGCANSAQEVKESRSLKPAHLNAPVSKTDPERIKLTLQEQRLKCAQLEQALIEMCVELEKASMEIDNELSNDFVKILDCANTKVTPFMKLLWQEQRKVFTRRVTGRFANVSVRQRPVRQRMKSFRQRLMSVRQHL